MQVTRGTMPNAKYFHALVNPCSMRRQHMQCNSVALVCGTGYNCLDLPVRQANHKDVPQHYTSVLLITTNLNFKQPLNTTIAVASRSVSFRLEQSRNTSVIQSFSEST